MAIARIPVAKSHRLAFCTERANGEDGWYGSGHICALTTLIAGCCDDENIAVFTVLECIKQIAVSAGGGTELPSADGD